MNCKMLFVMVLSLIFSFFVSAQDWNSADYVNSVDWSTYQDWDKVDWNSIDWSQADWNALDANDINTILSHNTAALDNAAFFERFDQKLTTFSGGELEKFSTNYAAFSSWAEKKGFHVDIGAGLFAYDGISVTTTGSQSTEFPIDDFPGALVLDTGALKLPDGTTIYPAQQLSRKEIEQGLQPIPAYVTREGNVLLVHAGSVTNFLGGSIAIETIGDKTIKIEEVLGLIKVENGRVVSGETLPFLTLQIKGGELDVSRVLQHRFFSPGEMLVTSSESLTISGKEVLGEDLTGSNTDRPVLPGKLPVEYFTFSGSLEQKKTGGGITSSLLPGGSYTDRYNEETDHGFQNQPLFQLTVTQPTVVRGFCSTGSCVQRQGLELFVNAEDGNEIVLRPGNELSMLSIPPIRDKSLLTIEQEHVRLQISKEGKYQLQGDLKQLLSEVRVQQNAKDYTALRAGQVAQCPEGFCKGLAVARYSGTEGLITHVAAGRTDGLRNVLQQARENEFNAVGWEGRNLVAAAGDVAQSDILIVSGHHSGGKKIIHGDNGEFKIDELPPSDKVQVVAFSACSTARGQEDVWLQRQLEGKYPNVKAIVGWSGSAPLVDGELVWEKAVPLLTEAVKSGNYEQLQDYVVNEGKVGEQWDKKWNLGIYVKEGQQWKWCSPKIDGCRRVH